MRNWKRLIGTTGLCLALVTPLTANALEPSLPLSTVRDILAFPTPIVENLNPSSVIIRGELTYMDIEGGYYSVAGYRLIANEQELAPYLGQTVVVTGKIADDISIFMTKAIQVESLLPTSELVRITGKLIYQDLEGGFYSVDGYRLIGDENEFAALLNQQVIIVGTPSDEISIFMTKAIEVQEIITIPAPEQSIFKEVEAIRSRPERISVDGVIVDLGSVPVTNSGILMLPLRAIAEAAGAKVTWFSNTRTAKVELPDRVVSITLGQVEVEGADEQKVSMARAPEIIGDRLHVSADALSTVFGLLAMDAGEDELVLVTRHRLEEPGPGPQDGIDWGSVSGTIRQIESEGRTRILLEGEAMSNGEPVLMWLTLTEGTRIIWANSDEVASSSDLAVGQTIKATLTGPVLESYPAQGGTNSIVILK